MCLIQYPRKSCALNWVYLESRPKGGKHFTVSMISLCTQCHESSTQKGLIDICSLTWVYVPNQYTYLERKHRESAWGTLRMWAWGIHPALLGYNVLLSKQGLLTGIMEKNPRKASANVDPRLDWITWPWFHVSELSYKSINSCFVYRSKLAIRSNEITSMKSSDIVGKVFSSLLLQLQWQVGKSQGDSKTILLWRKVAFIYLFF